MILTEKDYRKIAKQINEGRNVLWYDKDGETLSIACELEIEGYVEDDYFRGTGAFVETARNLFIENAVVFDKEGNESPYDVDEKLLRKLVA